MRVLKFGGTSVADAASLGQVTRIVERAAASEQVMVVVSAQAGVTDALVGAADHGRVEGLVATLARHHLGCLQAVRGPGFEAAQAAVAHRLGELEELLARPPGNQQRPAWHDAVLACGERLSVPVMVAALRAAGLEAAAFDATDLVVTDASFGEATVDQRATRQRVASWLGNLSTRVVPVVTGFIGGTEDGRVTTLGRGGSDYSAAVLGAASGASVIEIWTDVAGVMSASPRIVPDAVRLPALTFAVAREVAELGGKVLHPKTMEPAERAGVPIAVRCTFEAEQPGTVVGRCCRSARRAIGVTGVEGGAAVARALAGLAEPIDGSDLCVVGVVRHEAGKGRGAVARHAALLDRLRLPTMAVLASPSGHALLSLHRGFHLRRVVSRLHDVLVHGRTEDREHDRGRASLAPLPAFGIAPNGLAVGVRP
ncbi:MAG: aspartate kinase [Thermoanaerobaculaceae bacterium]|nr:aspartate kinase [Thermoanaerobaculaceae bacterium]MDI9622659.1 aspartate kinase [Acidobacteriota bacterium]NLH10520.1 aspartate kinase [Holophagae bacterium]HPW54592.1 aspartate kinase [Thermoanaerobaculaceae bacterium]